MKADQGGEVFSAAREEEVLANVLDANKGPLQEVTLKADLPRTDLRFAGGPEGSAHRVPRAGIQLQPSRRRSSASARRSRTTARRPSPPSSRKSIRKHADYGVVPLENSTDGRIADTLDMFMRMPQVKICAEIRLRVHHHLLANCEQTEMRRVYSKAQALCAVPQLADARTCRTRRCTRSPARPTRPSSSRREPNVAAVASRQAAVRYGISILCHNIEDSPFNETRFAVIGQSDSAKTGNDKTAMMFQIRHTPGALVDVLGVFKSNKLNLTWIESFPYREAKGRIHLLHRLRRPPRGPEGEEDDRRDGRDLRFGRGARFIPARRSRRMSEWYLVFRVVLSRSTSFRTLSLQMVAS